MATESKDNQFKWFVKLSETQGLEAANKYAEILSQIPQHIEAVMPKTPMTLNAPTIQNVDLMFENLVNGPAPNLASLIGNKEHPSNDTAPFRGNLPSVPNRNGSDHSSVTSLNDLLLVQQNDLELHAKNSMHKHQPQQTVPLYQRQAGSSFNIQPSNMQMPMMTHGNDIGDHNLFENLFNHNGSNLNQSHASNDLHGNAQHFQGLPPLPSFVNPAKSLSNPVNMTQK